MILIIWMRKKIDSYIMHAMITLNIIKYLKKIDNWVMIQVDVVLFEMASFVLIISQFLGQIADIFAVNRHITEAPLMLKWVTNVLISLLWASI